MDKVNTKIAAMKSIAPGMRKWSDSPFNRRELLKQKNIIIILAILCASIINSSLAASFNIAKIVELPNVFFTLFSSFIMMSAIFNILYGCTIAQQGIYLRTTEPIRFWFFVIFKLTFGILLSIGLWNR